MKAIKILIIIALILIPGQAIAAETYEVEMTEIQYLEMLEKIEEIKSYLFVEEEIEQEIVEVPLISKLIELQAEINQSLLGISDELSDIELIMPESVNETNIEYFYLQLQEIAKILLAILFLFTTMLGLGFIFMVRKWRVKRK